MKLMLVSSSGGHLIKTVALKEWWRGHQRVWVVRDDPIVANLLKSERKYFGYFPENRNGLNFIKNLFLAIKLISAEKPELIFSMGAGIALPFFLIAKIYKIKTVFIETFILIPKATLTGKLIYKFHLADVFLVQNKKLLNIYPRALHKGSLYDFN